MTDDFIPFHQPSIGDGERAAVLEVLDSGWLTTGSRTVAFEEAFREAVGARHAVAVNSATAALHLAMEAIGIGPGDEVVVPAYTFTSSAETVLYLGARPALADVDPRSANVTPEAVAAAMTPATRAVEVVHVAGLPADVGGVRRVAPGSAVLEDTAHAFPSPVAAAGGRLAGTLGTAGAFSFYATKTITTAEGGMLVTDDDAIADRARQMRLHGISRDAWKRYSAAGSWFYEVEAAGFKYNMTDLAAALGLVQLARAHELRAARASIARRYLDGLADAERDGRLHLPVQGTGDEHAWHLFVIRLRPDGPAVDGTDVDLAQPGVAGLPAALQPVATVRARLIDDLRRRGVGASVHFIPLHLHPLYRSLGYRPGQFPGAEAAYAGAVSLPIWPGMSDAQVDRVIDAVLAATALTGSRGPARS
jgi:perosamine synthetase